MNNKSLDELKKRNLDNCYFSIYCVSQEVLMDLGNGKIDKEVIYLFYGCNLLGQRRYISSITASSVSLTSDWYDFFQSFKSRGLIEVVYAVFPDIKPMIDAIKLSFLNVDVFISIFDAINSIYKYFSHGYTNSLFPFIKNVFLANDLNDYKINRDKFNLSFSSPFTLDLINPFFDKAKDYYFLPLNMRKAIFAFYFIRENIKKLSVISHSKHYFSSLDDFIVLCVPIFQIFEARTYCSKKTWVSILDFLYSAKKDLIKPFL